MHIAICDDSNFDIDLLKEFLENYFLDNPIEYIIDDFNSGTSLIYEIQDGKNYDVVFLDIIYMDEALGIDIARKLRNMGFNGNIIFTTGTERFAIDGYDVNATDYLLKPYGYDKLCRAMNKVVGSYGANVLRIRHRNSIVRINYKDILFIESNNSKCIVHIKDGSTYNMYKKLDEIENDLNDIRFLRCHQSYLVNMDYIKKADKQFELVNGDIVNIRQRMLKKIKDQYYEYIERKN